MTRADTVIVPVRLAPRLCTPTVTALPLACQKLTSIMVIWLGLMPVTATTSLPKSTLKEPTESASMETLDEVLEAWDTESRRHHVRGEGVLH